MVAYEAKPGGMAEPIVTPREVASRIARAAFAGRAQVRHYPCDRFDVWPGKEWHEPAVAHQVAFLRRVLGAR
jgi:hypothetical protein